MFVKKQSKNGALGALGIREKRLCQSRVPTLGYQEMPLIKIV
jgi:hypothetical protein